MHACQRFRPTIGFHRASDVQGLLLENLRQTSEEKQRLYVYIEVTGWLKVCALDVTVAEVDCS